MLGIRPPTVRKMLRENRLPVVRFNRRVLFDPASLRAFVRDHAIEPVPNDPKGGTV
jgi:excisionase family DNA binding protein